MFLSDAIFKKKRITEVIKKKYYCCADIEEETLDSKVMV